MDPSHPWTNRRTYKEREIRKYVDQYHASGKSLNQFARQERIPNSCLKRWVKLLEKNGAVVPQKRRSPMYLDIEAELYQWVLEETARGFPPNQKDLQTKALEIGKNLGKKDFFASCGWIVRFKARKELSFRSATLMSRTERDLEGASSDRTDQSVKRKSAVPEPRLLPEAWLYASSADWPQVVLFGDSHFQNGFANNGIASLIAAKLQRRCDVVTRGFNGYNTKLARCAFDCFLPKLDAQNIAAFVIMFGSNDACQEGDRSHVDLQEYSDNLTYFASRLKSYGVAANRIILISPPPSNQEAWTKVCQTVGRTVSTRENSVMERYALSAGIVAQRERTHFVDLFSAMFDCPNWTSFFTDGLHLNPEGAQKMYSVLGPFLDIVLQSCTLRFPDWKEVDPDNPEADFVSFS